MKARRFLVGANWSNCCCNQEGIDRMLGFLSSCPMNPATDMVIGCPPRWISYARKELPVEVGVATQYFSEIDNENSNLADADYGADWVILKLQGDKKHNNSYERLAQVIEAGFKVVACFSVDTANNESVDMEMDLIASINALAPSVKDWSKLVIAVEITTLTAISSNMNARDKTTKQRAANQSGTLYGFYEQKTTKDSVQRCNVCKVNTHSTSSSRCESSLNTLLEVQKLFASLRQWLRVNVNQEAAEITRLLLLTKSNISLDIYQEYAKVHDLDGFLVEGSQAFSADILQMTNTARFSSTELLLRHKQIKSTSHLIRSLRNVHFINKTMKGRSIERCL